MHENSISTFVSRSDLSGSLFLDQGRLKSRIPRTGGIQPARGREGRPTSERSRGRGRCRGWENPLQAGSGNRGAPPRQGLDSDENEGAGVRFFYLRKSFGPSPVHVILSRRGWFSNLENGNKNPERGAKTLGKTNYSPNKKHGSEFSQQQKEA